MTHIVGVIGGGGLGAIAGLVIAARDQLRRGWGLLVGAIIGSVAGVAMLLRSHTSSTKLVTPSVVVMWIVAVGSVAFLWLLYDAIRNFE